MMGTGEGMLLMDAFGLDDSTVIFSGITQSSQFVGMDFAWKSTNSGVSLTPLLGSSFSGTNICEMLSLMEISTSADFGDANNGVLIGIGFPQDCIDDCDGMDELQAFVHMITCMLQAGTKVT